MSRILRIKAWLTGIFLAIDRANNYWRFRIMGRALNYILPRCLLAGPFFIFGLLDGDKPHFFGPNRCVEVNPAKFLEMAGSLAATSVPNVLGRASDLVGDGLTEAELA